MELAIRFNNFGCTLYDLGRFEESHHLFSGALRALYLFRELGIRDLLSDWFVVDPHIRRALNVANDGGLIPTEAAASTLKRKRASTPENYSPTATTESPDDSLSLFIRHEPFSIEESRGTAEEPSVHLIMTVLLFNNALLCQIQGKVTNANPTIRAPIINSNNKEQSVALYSMAAQELFGNHPLDLIIESSRPAALLGFSILNNFGYALHEIQNYGSSRYCFGTLHGILYRLGPPLSTHEQELRELFATNVFVFYHSGETPSAAAA